MFIAGLYKLKNQGRPYSETDIKQALEMIKTGQMYQGEASRTFSIPRATLYNRLNKPIKEEDIEMFNNLYGRSSEEEDATTKEFPMDCKQAPSTAYHFDYFNQEGKNGCVCDENLNCVYCSFM